MSESKESPASVPVSEGAGSVSNAGLGGASDDDRFCKACGYDLGLHGTDEPDGYDCYIARQKADLLMMFGRAFR